MFRPSLLLLVAPLAFAGCGFGDTNDADGSAPAIQITKPEGDTVHDVVDFAALVIDDRGVQVVEFYVNDAQIGPSAARAILDHNASALLGIGQERQGTASSSRKTR